MQGKPAHRVADERPIDRRHAVGDGEDGSHDGTDEHGSDDGDVRIGVQADAGDDHGDHENTQVGSVEARPVDEALPDHMVGCAAFSDVECAPEESMKVMAPAFERAALAVPAPVSVDVLSQILVVFCQDDPSHVCTEDLECPCHLGILVPSGHRVNVWDVGFCGDSTRI